VWGVRTDQTFVHDGVVIGEEGWTLASVRVESHARMVECHAENTGATPG
jgi:hypothetical protein